MSCCDRLVLCLWFAIWKVTYTVPVPEGDPYFTVKLQDYTAVEKDDVVLDCELSKDIDVMWYHNEAELKASKMVTIKAEAKRRTVIIKKVGNNDKGQYVCDCGTDKTTATLHIEGKDAELFLVNWYSPLLRHLSFFVSLPAQTPNHISVSPSTYLPLQLLLCGHLHGPYNRKNSCCVFSL